MKNLQLILTTCILLFFVSCASRETKQAVESQVQKETVVKKEDLKENTLEYISNNQNLSQQQKDQLMKLHQQATADMTKLNEEITKTKMVLIKTLMEPKVSRSKVAVLRKDLKKLEKKKMDTSLSSFDKAQNIISPIADNETRHQLYHSFMMREGNYF